MNGPFAVHKGTKSKLRPKSPNGRRKAVNLFEGIFITADGRRVGRRESGDATEVRARQSGAQISAASRPVTHPLQRQCHEHLDSETDMDAEGRLLEVKKVDINTFENNTTLT